MYLHLDIKDIKKIFKNIVFASIGNVQQLSDQKSSDSIGLSNISKQLKTPKRINHKGETMLHVLAIKVNIKLCYVIYSTDAAAWRRVMLMALISFCKMVMILMSKTMQDGHH